MPFRLTLLILALVSSSAIAKDLCSGGDSRQVAVAGFCIVVADSTQVSESEMLELRQKIVALETRFPHLFKKVQQNGYRKIVIQPDKMGESGGTVLAETNAELKLVTIFRGYFSVGADNEFLKQLPFSVADVALLHEFLHAFDESNTLVVNNLRMVGWDLAQNAPADGLKTADIPQITNIWVSNAYVSQIKKQLGPTLQTDGPWRTYIKARDRMKKTGYPSIYAALGGPVESFAELGAYVALDPEAMSYVRAESVRWFQENVLK